MDEGFEECSEKGSFGLNLEVMRITPSTGLNQGRKKTRAGHKRASSSQTTIPPLAPLIAKNTLNIFLH